MQPHIHITIKLHKVAYFYRNVSNNKTSELCMLFKKLKYGYSNGPSQMDIVLKTFSFSLARFEWPIKRDLFVNNEQFSALFDLKYLSHNFRHVLKIKRTFLLERQ